MPVADHVVEKIIVKDVLRTVKVGGFLCSAHNRKQERSEKGYEWNKLLHRQSFKSGDATGLHATSAKRVHQAGGCHEERNLDLRLERGLLRSSTTPTCPIPTSPPRCPTFTSPGHAPWPPLACPARAATTTTTTRIT